ncbi:hypothetical protein TNCV_4097541 [Trichonephila clavipes]|nr:hypothetical protein TNCV_4097541 [Trichonephila clavipes]
MAWPAYSPDINPIENLFIDLENALQEEWRLLDSAVVDHLIESMARSCTRAFSDGPRNLEPYSSVEDDI